DEPRLQRDPHHLGILRQSLTYAARLCHHLRTPGKETPMQRRRFLQVTTGGLAGILASRRAPAPAPAPRIHLLHWPNFIPEADVELRRQIAEYNKQMKTDVFMENINGNDIQARITSAVQSGAGPDIFMMLHNWPHLYANALADVSDLAEWKGKD